MRLLLIIAVLIASLQFTGLVNAADFCADHDCQQELIVGHDGEPSQSSDTCDDCCLSQCGHAVLAGKAPQFPALNSSEFRHSDPSELHGYQPSGLLKPPRAV